MTDRERLEKIEAHIKDERNTLEQHLLMDDKRWLIDTLKKYMNLYQGLKNALLQQYP